jgi:hypothetical protein
MMRDVRRPGILKGLFFSLKGDELGRRSKRVTLLL